MFMFVIFVQAVLTATLLDAKQPKAGLFVVLSGPLFNARLTPHNSVLRTPSG